MNILELIEVNHNVKVGDSCPDIKPNVIEDTIFTLDNIPVGFYLRNIADFSSDAAKFANIANCELRTKRVPKSVMKRSSGFMDDDKDKQVEQYSTIIGSIPPKPHMRRDYATRSSVHNVPTAKTFIKAMLLLAKASEVIIEELTPHLYIEQKKAIEDNIAEEWRFGDLFTSSISNYNIAADFHRDNANLKHCANVIITKRLNSTGGCTTIPDYNATVDSVDNSMLYYPAWRNIHGVTPIIPTHKNGYRNTLVFYPLKNFPASK